MTVVIPELIATAQRIAKPSIHAVFLWSGEAVIISTIIEIKAQMIRIMRVKSSSASSNNYQNVFILLGGFLLLPKWASRDLREDKLIPLAVLV